MLQLRVHHLGYLVKKKAQAEEAFLALGYAVRQDWVHDTARGIDIAFLEKDGLCVELVCPFTKDSVVSGLLARQKNSPYHICYISENLEKDGEALHVLGFLPIAPAAPAPACAGHAVQFFLHPALGMIELLEKPFPFH